VNDTQRISAEELQQLQKKLEEGGGPELTVPVTPQILARLDAVLIQLQAAEDSDMSFQDAVQRVFMRGLELVESEL
jgi:hypothetical protein